MRFKTIIPIALCLMVVTVEAQQVLNFEQILQAALTSHPLVLGKRSSQAAAEAEREGAEWQRYPSLTLEANTQSSSQDANQSAGMLRIDQPLWSGGRVTADIKAAGSRFDAAGAAVDEARQELTFKVIAAITEAVRQQARQQHAIVSVKEHERLLAMIQRRVEQEVSPQVDQSLAASRLYASISELSITTQSLNNALAQLSQLAGQTVRVIDQQGLSEVGAPDTLETAMSQALAYSPTLRRLTFEEEAARSDIASKRAAYLPQLVLRMENTQGGLVSDNRVMLVLLAQPGAGLSAVSSTEAAFARREAARMAREAAVRDMRDRVTLDWNEWVAARLRLEYANQGRAMSAEVTESYSRQYTAGRKSWIDVLNAVREATLSELAAEDARSQMLAASLRLRELTGTLTDTSASLQ